MGRVLACCECGALLSLNPALKKRARLQDDGLHRADMGRSRLRPYTFVARGCFGDGLTSEILRCAQDDEALGQASLLTSDT